MADLETPRYETGKPKLSVYDPITSKHGIRHMLNVPVTPEIVNVSRDPRDIEIPDERSENHFSSGMLMVDPDTSKEIVKFRPVEGTSQKIQFNGPALLLELLLSSSANPQGAAAPAGRFR